MATTEEFKALGRRRRQLDRVDPRRRRHRLRRRRRTSAPSAATPSSRGTTSARGQGLGKLYERAKTSQWNGSTDLDWSIDVDVEFVALEMQAAIAHLRDRAHGPPRIAPEVVDREGVDEPRDRGVQVAHEPVPPRRAGRAHLHGQDRRDRAVDRREVLRVHAGHGRGPPRRGVRPLPRHQARGPLPGQPRAPAAHRRHHRTTTAGT